MSQRNDIAIIRSDDDFVDVKDVLSGKHDKALRFLSQYAALSAKVYEDTDAGKETQEVNKVINDWVADWQPLNFNFDDFRPEQTKGKWIKGLKVDSYYKYEDGMTYVTIIFRGTRFNKWQDWFSNANWLTRYIPYVHNSYKQTILQIDAYISAISQYLIDQNIAESKNAIKFISTGHSLGGGLAQQAAYASCEIVTVYAFDPSPVTGYYSVKRSKRHNNVEGLKIYRIWEHGEVLLYLRQITKTAQKISFNANINPRIVEVRFNFVEHVNAISEHSMVNLATSLIQVEQDKKM